MRQSFTIRLESDVVRYIKEVAADNKITQREVVELCVLASMRLGLFEALEGSGIRADDYGSLVRVACDDHIADQLYQYVKGTVSCYKGTLWD